MSRPINRIVLDDGSGINLVITEICDDCDTERPTTLCAKCKQPVCDDCIKDHECRDDDLTKD